MNIAEFRQKYPQYDKVEDNTLSRALHKKFYSNVEFDTFNSKFSVPAQSTGAVATLPTQSPKTAAEMVMQPDYVRPKEPTQDITLGKEEKPSLSPSEQLNKKKKGRKIAGFWDELGRNIAGGSFNVASGLVGTLSKSPISPIPLVGDLGSVLGGQKIGEIVPIERIAQELAEKAKEPAFSPAQDGGVKGFVASAVGQTLPFMAASTLATILTGTPVAAFGVGFAVEGDSAFRDAIESGADENEAHLDRMIVGTLNGAIEQMQVGGILKFAKKGGVKTLLNAAKEKSLKKLFRKGLKLTTNTVKHSINEGLEEALQETVGIVTPAITRGEKLPTAKEFGKRVGKAGLGGAVVGGILGGAGSIVGKTEAGQAQVAEIEPEAVKGEVLQPKPTKTPPKTPVKPPVRPVAPSKEKISPVVPKKVEQAVVAPKSKTAQVIDKIASTEVAPAEVKVSTKAIGETNKAILKNEAYALATEGEATIGEIIPLNAKNTIFIHPKDWGDVRSAIDGNSYLEKIFKKGTTSGRNFAIDDWVSDNFIRELDTPSEIESFLGQKIPGKEKVGDIELFTEAIAAADSIRTGSGKINHTVLKAALASNHPEAKNLEWLVRENDLNRAGFNKEQINLAEKEFFEGLYDVDRTTKRGGAVEVAEPDVVSTEKLKEGDDFSDFFSFEETKGVYGGKNKIVTTDDYNAAKERLSKGNRLLGKPKKGQRRGGAKISPQDLVDATSVGVYHFEAGLRSFKDWSARMIKELGEAIKPSLATIWKDVQKTKSDKDLRKQIAKQEEITDIKAGKVPTEPVGLAMAEHIEFLEKIQLPKTSKIPILQRNIRQVNGRRLAGTITPSEANKQISQLRKGMIKAAKDEGVSLRVSPAGKVKIALRDSGVFVPQDFSEHTKFNNIGPVMGGGQDITRAVQQMDGALSLKEKTQTPGQAGPIERYVLWRTRDMQLQKLEWLKEKTVKARVILSSRKGSNRDQEINKILEKIGEADRDKPIKDVLSSESLKSFASKDIEAAQALRDLYDEMINEQNEARALRGQKEIPYRQNYSPHILRNVTIWEQLLNTTKSSKEAVEKDLPDYIRPNKPFNPREMAREADMPYDLRVKSARDLLESYIITAGKDIFNTSIIQNNKAFIDQMRGLGQDKSANYLSEWTATAFAGVKPALDRAVKLPVKVQRGLRWFNKVRNLAVFPFNFSWSLSTQFLSLANTVGRYGSVNTARGFVQWLHPTVRRKSAEEYYSFIVKSSKQGKVTKQDASNLIGANIAIKKTPLEFVSDFGSIFLTEMEKLLTGTSIQAAHITGKQKGLTGEALRNFASDGGGKTQSMYNSEDKPMLLNNLAVKSAAPYQTYAFEVANTFREFAGRTGTPPNTKLLAMWQVTRWVASMVVLRMLANRVRNKEWSWWELVPIPFSEFWLSPIAKKFTNERISPSSGLAAPVQMMDRLAKGVDDVLETGDWRKLRSTMITYGPGAFGVPGGVQWNRTVDSIIGYSQGGIRDRRGRLQFKINDSKDLARGIFTGVWSTKGGKERLNPKKKTKSKASGGRSGSRGGGR